MGTSVCVPTLLSRQLQGGLGVKGVVRGGFCGLGSAREEQGITPRVRSIPDPGLCASWEKQLGVQRGCSDPNTAIKPPWEGPLGPWTCLWPA